jgi:hypothetical protein
VLGMAGAEKSLVAATYAFAGRIPPATAKPTTTN